MFNSMFLHRAPIWGVLRNGTLNGVIGMYPKNQIEVSATPFSLRVERVPVFDYLVISWLTTPTIVFRHPQSGFRNIFLQPLSPWVWHLIVILVLVVSILITTMMGLIKKKTQIVSFPRAFVITIGILCQQGFIENIQKQSVRVTFFVTIMFSLIIYQFYSSFIVSSLLTSPPKTLSTVRKLIDSHLKVGIEDIAYNIDFFQTTTDKVALELFKKKIERNNNFFPVEEGLCLMQKGGFAFHVDTSYGYQLIREMMTEDEICELHEMLLFPIRPLYQTVAKDSPYREFFIVNLQRLRENGIMNYHRRRWSAAKPKCVKSITKIKAVDMGQASVIFILLAVAVLVSFLVLFGEIVHFKMTKRFEK